MRHGSGEGREEHGRAVAGAHRPQGRPGPSGGAGEAHPGPAVLRGQDPDGGLRRGGHLPGPGLPAGEGGHQYHQKEYLGLV